MEGGGKAPVPEEHGDTSAKAAAAAAALEVASASGGRSRAASRGLAVLDLILRFVAVIGTVGSAIAMGTTNQTLPFFTQFLLFKAQYDDLPTLTFFVVVNSIVAAYLVLSIPLSIVHIIRSRAKYSRLVLVFFDAAMLALVTSAASAATAIVYLAAGAQGKRQGQLVRHLPAVRRLLQAHLGVPHRLLCGHGPARAARRPLRRRAGPALDGRIGQGRPVRCASASSRRPAWRVQFVTCP
ncbi:unnamed protein product [Urochloa decumbens]|uniref:CASP-like protein n=1 Tax=Urochloa decumbens TaxID=240449 RepID=A0ABC9EE93_9POAL